MLTLLKEVFIFHFRRMATTENNSKKKRIKLLSFENFTVKEERSARIVIGVGTLILVGLILGIGYRFDQVQAPAQPEMETYTSESWKTLIDQKCQHFFDGCNQCSRVSGSDQTTCTRMFCEVYQKPKCTDEEQQYNSESRKTMIDENCKFFFDGCNNCTRQPNSNEITCHELYCETYQKPRCTDNEIQEWIKNSEQVPSCEEWDEQGQCAITFESEIQNPGENQPKEISREEAKKLILWGKVRQIFQSHALDVKLTTKDGKKFHTKEDRIDDIFKVIDQCGNPCKDIPLATE